MLPKMLITLLLLFTLRCRHAADAATCRAAFFFAVRHDAAATLPPPLFRCQLLPLI